MANVANIFPLIPSVPLSLLSPFLLPSFLPSRGFRSTYEFEVRHWRQGLLRRNRFVLLLRLRRYEFTVDTKAQRILTKALSTVSSTFPALSVPLLDVAANGIERNRKRSNMHRGVLPDAAENNSARSPFVKNRVFSNRGKKRGKSGILNSSSGSTLARHTRDN